MRAINYLLLLVFLSTIACAQSDKLTKEKALEIIKKDFKADCEQLLTMETFSGRNNYNEIMAHLRKLEKEGYLYIKSYTIRDIQGSYKKVQAKLTEDTKLKFSGKSQSTMYGKKTYYKVALAEIVEVTGIAVSDGGNSAKVRFNYKLKPTALYPIRRKRGKSSDCSTNVNQAEAKFIKFDTGWQIEKPKYGW